MRASILVIDENHAEHYRNEILKKFPDVEVHTALTRDHVGEEVRNVDAMWGIGTTRIFGDENIRKAARLKWIQAFTAGSDGIVSLPSLRPDVTVTCMRGIHGPQMSEMAFLFMIGLGRNFARILRNQQKARWDRFPQMMVFGKTVAIVGVGIIGADLAVRAKACGMQVIGVSRTPRDVEGFDEMLPYERIAEAAAKSDFLVIVTSYSKETHRLIGRKVLDAMKPSAYLVNISRGGVVDEEALLEALQQKRIAGAGLDVFASEPLAPGHPFWSMENVMVTPHLGGGADFMPALQTEILEHNLRCFLEGRMSDMINIVHR